MSLPEVIKATKKSPLSRGFMNKLRWGIGLMAVWLTLSPAMAEVMVSNAQIKLGIGDRPAAMHAVIMNHGDADTALIGAQSPAFSRIELHTHETDGRGMMRMMQVESYALAANGVITLKPGGDHLMLFDYAGKAGDAVDVTLIFANGTRKTVNITPKARGKHKGHMNHHMGHDSRH